MSSNKKGSKTAKKTRKVTKFAVTENDLSDKLEEIKNALRENYLEQKRLSNELNQLLKTYHKEVKLEENDQCPSINKPERIPECLRQLLGIEEKILPRFEVTRLIYRYFKDHQMYDPKREPEIIANDQIKKIFGMKKGDVISLYNLQSWLRKIYEKESLSTKGWN